MFVVVFVVTAAVFVVVVFVVTAVVFVVTVVVFVVVVVVVVIVVVTAVFAHNQPAIIVQAITPFSSGVGGVGRCGGGRILMLKRC